MKFKGENFLIVGLSKSGVAAARLLLRQGARVLLYDQMESERTRRAVQELSPLGAESVRGEGIDAAIKRSHAVVLSPGVAIDNSVSLRAHQENKRVLGELELGSLFLRAPMVAVTGTNGKTTTVCMVTDIFKESGVHAEALGNVGVPLSERAEKFPKDGVAVVEVSSFQLETVHAFTPHVAVLLNLTEDHLNRHYNMKNYAHLKARLFRNLRESEYAVLNDACPLSHEIARKTRANVLWFSTEKRVEGAYAENGEIYFAGTPLFRLSDLPLRQKHNVENALASLCVAKAFGIDMQIAKQALSKFRGARHRLEVVCQKGGVTFVNDSKATNPGATLSAVQCVKQPTVLLIGGQEKGYSYRPLFQALKNTKVRYAVLYGENREQVKKDALSEGFTAYSIVENLFQAVKVGEAVAKSGETVLLSPASASFDEFSGYDARGNAFIRYVSGEGTAKSEGEENAKQQSDG